MNYYYKILLNLHRKPTAIYSLSSTLAFHLPQSIRKSIGWETVANANRTDRFWIGLDEIYDDHEDLD
jgi:hypothetical protein